MQARLMNKNENVTPVVMDYEAIRAEAIKRDFEKRKAEKLEQLLQFIPLRFRGNTLAAFREDYPEQAKIKFIIDRYIRTYPERLAAGNCMVLHGKPGTGKTMLSLIVYESIAKQGFTVGYESSLQFLRLFREKEFESNAEFNSLMDSYLRKSLLIIDEATEGVGKCTFPADWERKLLFNLINARYEKNLCTIVISNRTKAEIIERLGEPTVDRLSDSGIFLAFNWNSYRK